jgi:hypothetical protein
MYYGDYRESRTLGPAMTNTALNARLTHGMSLIPRTPDLARADVNPDLRAVYDDIECTLRVPFVNFIFRTLANFPAYFQPAWNSLAPHLRTRTFERAAERLRSEAAVNLSVAQIGQEAVVQSERQALANFNDAIHYVLPKLLLIVTALDLQWQGEYAVKPVPEFPLDDALPYGVAAGAGRLPLVDPAGGGEHVQALFSDIQQVHTHPGVASYYRGLANYPAFLETAWSGVRQHIGSDDYKQRKQALLVFAETHVAREVLQKRSQPVADGDDSVGAILAVFRYRLIPDLLLDVTLIKAMLSGPNAAAYSRFSCVD